MKVAWLAEPKADKIRFFKAIAAAADGGTRLPTWPMSWRGFAETNARAADCLARAKYRPKAGAGQALKLAFLKGRYNWSRRWFAAHPDHLALCWQGLTGTRRAVMLGARDAGAKTLFAELAPFPDRRTLDPKGVNAEGSVPQDPAFYADVVPDTDLLDSLHQGFQSRTSRRADVGQGASLPHDTGPFVFVPLQVPDDSQMILFAGWVGDANGFVAALQAASDALPQGWHLRVKEHPSSRIALTDQIKAAIAAGARVVLDNATDSFAQLGAARAVLTVNSSMGLQAMFFDKPVIVTGRSFYGLPGLVTHADCLTALRTALSGVSGLQHDAGLRARFLTWLAQSYYIRAVGDDYDAAQIRARLDGVI